MASLAMVKCSGAGPATVPLLPISRAERGLSRVTVPVRVPPGVRSAPPAAAIIKADWRASPKALLKSEAKIGCLATHRPPMRARATRWGASPRAGRPAAPAAIAAALASACRGVSVASPRVMALGAAASPGKVKP